MMAHEGTHRPYHVRLFSQVRQSHTKTCESSSMKKMFWVLQECALGVLSSLGNLAKLSLGSEN